MRNNLWFFVVALALIGTPSQGGAQEAVVAGKQVFARCAACHSDQPNMTKVGPSLYGVVGRTPGTLVSYKNYSAAMKAFGASGKVWDAQTLEGYLTNPRTYVPGNRMAFGGLANAADRKSVIAYLQSLKDQ